MNTKIIHRIFAAVVFLITLVQFVITAQPSVSFWDPGELSAAAYKLEVPHPPGGPLFSLVGHILYMIPFPGSLGFRMNLVSVLSSAFSILFLYLIVVRLVKIYKKRDPLTMVEAYGTYFSAAIGAFSLSFCDTFWFNGVEANYFAAATFLFSAIVWLTLVWYEKSEEPGSWKYFLMIAYLAGLAGGVHLMSVLTIFAAVMVIVFKRVITDDTLCKKTWYIFLGHVALLVVIALVMWGNQVANQPPTPDEVKDYDSNFKMIMIAVSALYVAAFWKKVFTKNSFYVPIVIAGVTLAFIYPGVIKKLPLLLLLIAGDNSTMGVIVLLAFLGALSYLSHWAVKNKRTVLAVAAFAAILSVAGVTTYTMIIIRAGQHPPMNENNPNSFTRLISYLDREQYGDFPMFKRRWSGEPQHQSTWANYSSDLDFFWRYQMNHMFLRYVEWNFIGREAFYQDAGINWSHLYGIPFFMGLLGVYFHFRKDWKMASVFLTLFVLMGFLIAFYQNQQQWQPRERDYFYAGAYFVFAVWIALGIRGLLDLVEEKTSPGKPPVAAIAGILCVAAFLIPGRMFAVNYHTHDRSRNWLPWDYSYNLLQSCVPNSILFTNGDNDTFPLWYLQDVEGIRRDVRIVNLSLVNTEWYIKQLKYDDPYGTAKLKIKLSDDYIDRIQGNLVPWKAQNVTIPVPRNVLEEYHVTDTSIINRGSITFNMKPTAYNQYLRTQDVLVHEIVTQNAWQRTIYFANTCSPDTKIGMDDYLRMEGFAARLVPEKRIPNPDVVYFIDEKSMEQNLFDESPGFSATYKPGFKFRGLNDSTIFFDANEQNMAQNYRGSFLMLATSYLYEDHDKSKCIQTLERMDKVLPESVVQIDPRQEYSMLMAYNGAGDSVKFRSVANHFEQNVKGKIADGTLEVSETNLYIRMLASIYEMTRQYSEAASLLEAQVPNFPNDPELRREIDRYKTLAGQQPK